MIVFILVPDPRVELGTPASSKAIWTISSPRQRRGLGACIGLLLGLTY